MSFNIHSKTCTLPDGREIIIETGKLARQADGSALLRMGNTMLLATVVANEEAKEGVDFLPLSVDYQEKFASTGKIPGGFLKRESTIRGNSYVSTWKTSVTMRTAHLSGCEILPDSPNPRIFSKMAPFVSS